MNTRFTDELLLTPREKQILVAIAEGLLNKAIAADLGIAMKTVDTHRQRLMAKLGIHCTALLTRYAIREGYLLP